MAFSNKQIAEYSELINNELDKIPVNNIEDFALILNTLEGIAQPESKYKEPDEFIELQDIQLKEFMSSISGICNDRELLYAPKEDFGEFQKIIRNRILFTINQFKKMSLSEKETYIRNQQSSKATVQAASAAMKNVTESKAWTEKQQAHNTGEIETEQQMLARRQREFQEEERRNAVIRAFQNIGISSAQLAAMAPAIRTQFIENYSSVRSLTIGSYISVEQLVAMDPAIRAAFLTHPDSAIKLIQIMHRGVYPVIPRQTAIDQLVVINPEIFNQLLTNADEVVDLATSGISLKQLIEMNPAIRTEFLQNPNAVSVLMTHAYITLNKLLAMNPAIRTTFLRNPGDITRLKRHTTLDQLIAMNPEILNQLMINSRQVKRLVRRTHIALEQLVAMNPAIRTEFLQNADNVSILLRIEENNSISLKQLLEVEPEICTEFIQNATAVRILIKDAIPFDQLVTMDPEIRTELISNPASFLELNKNKHISLEQLERLNGEQVHTVLSNPNSTQASEILSALKETSRKPWGR